MAKTPKLKPRYPYYLANKPVQANADLPVLDKYSGKVATRVAMADAKAIEQAIAAAAKAAAPMAALKPYQRRAVLEHCVESMRKRKDELAYALCVEAGKPIKDSQGEAERLIDTLASPPTNPRASTAKSSISKSPNARKAIAASSSASHWVRVPSSRRSISR